MEFALIGDIAGIIGVICFLVAYALLQADKLDSHAPNYLLLNLMGALLVIVSLLFSWNLSAFILETIWALISAYGLVKYYRRAR